MENLPEKVKPYFEHQKGKSGHGFDHAMRVYNLGTYIALQEKADVEIVMAACLLHDVGRGKGNDEIHEELGAALSQEILTLIGFPKEKIEEVVYCIKVHRYSKRIVPETKEARILQDADRLEEIGAISVSRVIAEDVIRDKPLHDPSIQPNASYATGKNKTTINFIIEKSLKLKPETFHTETARKIAQKRYSFTESYIQNFLQEWSFK